MKPSLNRILRKWVRAANGDRRFVRLDWNAFSNSFWAVGCEGNPQKFRVIISTTPGRTPEAAIRNMLRNQR